VVGDLSVVDSTVNLSDSLLGLAGGLEVREPDVAGGKVARLRMRLEGRDVRGAKWLSAIDEGVDRAWKALSGTSLWARILLRSDEASTPGSDGLLKCDVIDVEEVVRLCVSDGMHDV